MGENLSRRSEALLASGCDAVVQVDRSWTIVFASDPAYGVAPPEIVGRNLWEAFPVGVGSPCYSHCLQVMESRHPAEFLDHHPESGRWFIVRVVPHGDGLIINFRDITAHHQKQDVLENWETMRAVVDSLPVGIWLLDATGRIVASNPAARQIWGGDKHVGIDGYGEFVGWWHGTDERVSEWSCVKAIRQGEVTLDEEIDILCFDGVSRKTIRHSAIPLKAPDGRILGAVAVDQDITTERRAQRALVRARNRAEQAIMGRSQVIAALAHDLMQPLLGVRLHLTCALSEAGGEMAGTLKTAVAALLSAEYLVEALMESASLEADQVVPRMEVSDLREIVGHVCEEAASIAWVRGVELLYRRGRPVQVSTDAGLVLRIVRNLVSNAVRYSQRGRVLVALRRRRGFPAIEVWDTGLGIDEEALRRTLDAEDGAVLAPAFGGMGIGLQNVARLVRALGVKLEARSRLGRGTMFRLTFPTPGIAAAPAKPEQRIRVGV